MIWVPSYRPALVAELSARRGRWQATVTSFLDPREAHQGPFEAWRTRAHSASPVSAQTGAAAAAAAAKAGLWSAPRYQTGIGEDGSVLLLEGRVGTTYQLIKRWQPNDQPLGEAARTIVRLAGGAVPEEMMPRK